MERHELICFSIDPRLSAGDARAMLSEVLGREIQPRPGARLAVLSLEAARRAQRTLTRGGVVCNHRPLPEKHDLRLSETVETRPCPRCGTPAEIPQRRRNYRCPACRHPILRHGREIPALPPAPKTPPPPESANASRSVTGLLTIALILLCAGTVQPSTLADQGRNVWSKAIAPLAREFHFLTQSLALARQRSHGATSTVSLPSLPQPVAKVTTPPPPVFRPAPSADIPTPPAITKPSAPRAMAATADRRPEPATDTLRLPEAVRDSRSLEELRAALTAELETAPKTAPFPLELPGSPDRALPPLPPSPDIPPARIESAVTALDAHLARKAPFLRRLYARDLEQLAQLQKLTAVAQAPRHPASERTAARSIPTENPHTPVTPTKTPGFCPVWRKPAPLLCPA